MDHPDVTRLYKFMPWSDRVKALIENEEIWFSRMDAFNDPFEGIYSVNRNMEAFQFAALAFKHYQNNDGIGWSDISKLLSEKVVNEDLSIKEDALIQLDCAVDSMIDEVRGIGILSLSEVADSILMWSHYADNHKGICIEFERELLELSGDSKHCRPVQYSTDYPQPRVRDLLADEHLLTTQVVYTKAAEWSYEKEWRIWAEKGNTLRKTPGKIRSIILGASWDGDLDKVYEMAMGNSIKLKLAKKIEGRYEIEITPYIRK
ncbi:MAG: DUF2971 domain-containing protein [Sedimenticola sp.]